MPLVQKRRSESKLSSAHRLKERSVERWAKGYGVISHSKDTQKKIFEMEKFLNQHGIHGDGTPIFDVLYAADRVASAAMWLVVHETYAKRVFLDGRDLKSEDFKSDPQGHTGGSLNMVPAYIGYMAINAITGITRSWIMGQGHCVSAIDSVNLLLNNMTPSHEERYSLTDEGLTRYVQDFYSYKLGPDYRQDSPLGSHVNPNTAGGLAEGGYLGFTELQYVHMPLRGERLVVFLSDGAFEEQRGSDWVPRWWRKKDSGLVTPIMINNGRRIDQRTTLSQEKGGVEWFVKHLRLNSFDPIVFDGRDPAAFVWAIFEMERRLETTKGARYPVLLPYGVAVAPKGAGFCGEGTNLAHNLPLNGNPHTDSSAASEFNKGAHRLWVPPLELNESLAKLDHHTESSRPKERDNALVHRKVSLNATPKAVSKPVPEDRKNHSSWTRSSPMLAVDSMFLTTVKSNPDLRPRVGNPDEMRSNKLQNTLDYLKFRVTAPEKNLPEDVHGSVITALNEEAVASAALANKAGINLIATYEAFGAKMYGLIRQEITFTKQCLEEGREQDWIAIPLVLTSHTWENGKNELSHQDTTMCESLLGETSDISRVLFPADYNTAAVVMRRVYLSHGQIFTLVVPKKEIPDLFLTQEAELLLEHGAIRLDWSCHRVDEQKIILTAIGAYQLEEVLKASQRLRERDIPHSVVYMIEPGKFRNPRNKGESRHQTSLVFRQRLYPETVPSRIFVSHTRPENILGVLQQLNTGNANTRGFGFLGRGGTLQVSGMLFVNRCTWAHVLVEAADVLGLDRESLLSLKEIEAIDGKCPPEKIIT